uniref:PPM-type phosphatase domain-containing protein n=1 Tax=Brassica campestris TaxID=3711 RepID=M4DWL3_BRACM
MSFSQRLGTLKRYGIHNDKSGRSMVLYNSSSRSLNSSMTAPTRDHQTSSSLLDAISSSKLCRVARTGARPPQCPHAQEVAFGVERGESVTTSDRFAAYMTKGSRIVTNNNEYRPHRQADHGSISSSDPCATRSPLMFFPQVCSFPIYDGHGGCLAAEFAKKHLHLNVFQLGYRVSWYVLLCSD